MEEMCESKVRVDIRYQFGDNNKSPETVGQWLRAKRNVLKT